LAAASPQFGIARCSTRPHREPVVKTDAKIKRFNAGQDDAYLLKILAD
jgi:hypothetical protein